MHSQSGTSCGIGSLGNLCSVPFHSRFAPFSPGPVTPESPIRPFQHEKEASRANAREALSVQCAA